MSVQAATQRVLVKVIYNDRVFFFTPEMFSHVNDSMTHNELVFRSQYAYGVTETECILKNRAFSVDAMITDIALSKVVEKTMPRPDFKELWDRAYAVVDMQINPKDEETMLFGHEDFFNGAASIICQGHSVFITVPRNSGKTEFCNTLINKYNTPYVRFYKIGGLLGTVGRGKLLNAGLIILEDVGSDFDLDSYNIPEKAIVVSVATPT